MDALHREWEAALTYTTSLDSTSAGRVSTTCPPGRLLSVVTVTMAVMTTTQTTTLPCPTYHSDMPARGGSHAGHFGDRVGAQTVHGREQFGIGVDRFHVDGEECWPVIVVGGASLKPDEARQLAASTVPSQSPVGGLPSPSRPRFGPGKTRSMCQVTRDGPLYSPDGRYYWSGTEWVPVGNDGPAVASPQPSIVRTDVGQLISPGVLRLGVALWLLPIVIALPLILAIAVYNDPWAIITFSVVGWVCWWFWKQDRRYGRGDPGPPT
jgi:hypothetical protein